MDERFQNQTLEKRHSRLGIASVIAAIAIPVVWISVFAIGMLLGSRRGSIGTYIGLGGIIFALLAPFMHFVFSGLGLVGLFSKKTKNLFPVVGTILNALLGVTGILLIWLFVTNMTWGFR